MCSLNIYDVGDESIKIKGKGEKERIVPIAPFSLRFIDEYLANFRSLISNKEEVALFVTAKGQRIHVRFGRDGRICNLGVTPPSIHRAKFFLIFPQDFRQRGSCCSRDVSGCR